MNGQRILVVGRQPEIMLKVKALLESAGYVPLGALVDGEAIELMKSADIDALLIGGGVEANSRASLIQAFKVAKPGRPIIEHFGGPHGLLDSVRRNLPI